jgi:hypothetical protein
MSVVAKIIIYRHSKIYKLIFDKLARCQHINAMRNYENMAIITAHGSDMGTSGAMQVINNRNTSSLQSTQFKIKCED